MAGTRKGDGPSAAVSEYFKQSSHRVMSTRYCPICIGAGFLRRVDELPCAECGGNGGVYGRTCPGCNGRGTQLVEKHCVCVACEGTGLRIPASSPSDAD